MQVVTSPSNILNINGGIPAFTNFAAFPITAVDGSMALAADTDILYVYNATLAQWRIIGGPETSETVLQNIRYVSSAGNDTTGTGSFANPFLTVGAAQSSFTDISPFKYIFIGNGVFTEDNNFKWLSGTQYIGAGRFLTTIQRGDNSPIPWEPTLPSDPVQTSNNLFFQSLQVPFSGITITRAEPSYVGDIATITAINIPGNEITVTTGLGLPPTSPPAWLQLFSTDNTNTGISVIQYTSYDSGTGIMSGLTFPTGNDLSDPTQFDIGFNFRIAIPATVVYGLDSTLGDINYAGIGVSGDNGVQDQLFLWNCTGSRLFLSAIAATVSRSDILRTSIDSVGTVADQPGSNIAIYSSTHNRVFVHNNSTVSTVLSSFIVNGIVLDGANTRYITDSQTADSLAPITYLNGATFSNITLQASTVGNVGITPPAYLPTASSVILTGVDADSNAYLVHTEGNSTIVDTVLGSDTSGSNPHGFVGTASTHEMRIQVSNVDGITLYNPTVGTPKTFIWGNSTHGEASDFPANPSALNVVINTDLGSVNFMQGIDVGYGDIPQWRIAPGGEIYATSFNTPGGSVLGDSLTTGFAKFEEAGSNPYSGAVDLVGGTATVLTAAGGGMPLRIFLTSQTDGGVPGFLRVSSSSPGTNFTITSSSVLDTSRVAWVAFLGTYP